MARASQKADVKAELLEDIKFILSECERVSQLLRGGHAKENLIKLLSNIETVPFASFSRKGITCSREGFARLHKLTKLALHRKDYVGRLDYQEVYKALLYNFDKQFISNPEQPSAAKAEKLIASSLQWAEKTCQDQTHYIPCRLMYARDAQSFNVGPVLFRCAEHFDDSLQEKFDAYINTAPTKEQHELRTELLKEARSYYQQFTWVSEVCVQSCSPETSRDRAFLAVTAAVDALQLIFGVYHTERMEVGGPRLREDRRAHLHLDSRGMLDVSCSSNSTSAVGFSDDWLKLFEKEGAAQILRGAGKAIQSLVSPQQEYPVAMRFIDSVGWHGQAIRERFAAGRITKAITALERLLLVDENENIAETLAERSASLLHLYIENNAYDVAYSRVKRAYDLRSKLTHGSISPFDEEVTSSVYSVLKMTEQIIRCGLFVFEEYGLFERPYTNKELQKGFNGLVATACDGWSQPSK